MMTHAATMRAPAPLASTLVLALLLLPLPGTAQIGYPGMSGIPESDFTWTWGNGRDSGREREDFSLFGSDSGFRCDLRGRLRASGMGTMSRFDIRDLESRIRNEPRFISAASNRMAELEAQGALQWATLQCAKPKREE
jgi:hypothetical protein